MKLIIQAAALLLVVSSTPSFAQITIPSSERAALFALYHSTGGEAWFDNSGWLGPEGTEHSWYGIEVLDGHVHALFLGGNNLVGVLPHEIGDLSRLVWLTVEDNHLSGSIPEQIGSLDQLVFLWVNDNDFSGGFPDAMWNLPNLSDIKVTNNPNFGGEISPAIGNLHDLTVFGANSADLHGPIPPEIGNLSKLVYFTAKDNHLSGPLPPELGNCTNLIAVDLFMNDLDGPIPEAYRNLVNLEYFSLGNWRDPPRHGVFPNWIGDLYKLKSLWFYSAGLEGQIPTSICDLAEIETLNIGINTLSGDIPACVVELDSLEYLSFYSNALTGEIPMGFGDHPSLRIIDLADNHLSGSIPNDLAQIPNLEHLYLGYNGLSGSIPVGFGLLPHLKVIDLISNQLGGPIPSDLGQSPVLEFLRLADNHLTGPIPDELGNISSLNRLILSQNPFDPGPIPLWVRELPNLIALYLYDSNRTGGIPPEIGNLAHLYSMNLGMNNLTGSIPEELCNLGGLGYFQIADADLEGEIPACLAALPHLVSFKLDRNHISGAIPEGFSDTSSLRELTLGGNMLTDLPADLLEIEASDSLWFGSNALPIDDPTANAFLNQLNPDSSSFEATQTVPPRDLSAANTAVRSVALRWTPIPYRDYSGRYEVFAATGLGFELMGSTTDKNASSILIEGLEPDTTYRFKVRTVTDPVFESANPYHLNKNTVASGFSDEIVVTTLSPGSGTVIECSDESHDLNDSSVPAGWQLEIKNGGHLSNGKLWGQPTAGGCWLGKQIDSEGHLTSLEFTWDGSLETSYWGLYTGIYVTMDDGGTYTLLNGSWTANGENNFVRFKEPWDVGWEGSQQYPYPLENGKFSYDVNLRDEIAHFAGHRINDNSLAFDHTEPMQALILDNIQRVDFAVYATTGSSNWLDNPSLTVCSEFPDEDEDGVRDAYDECPESAPVATVMIDGCESGVVNHVGEDGCTVVDLVDRIAANAANHGKFASGVAHLLNGYVDEGLLTAADQNSIQSCAGQADIP